MPLLVTTLDLTSSTPCDYSVSILYNIRKYYVMKQQKHYLFIYSPIMTCQNKRSYSLYEMSTFSSIIIVRFMIRVSAMVRVCVMVRVCAMVGYVLRLWSVP